jgi:plasmid stabilization system protein ParE
MEVIIAPKARHDISSILVWTEENFGPQTLRRYARVTASNALEIGRVLHDSMDFQANLPEEYRSSL